MLKYVHMLLKLNSHGVSLLCDPTAKHSRAADSWTTIRGKVSCPRCRKKLDGAALTKVKTASKEIRCRRS